MFFLSRKLKVDGNKCRNKSENKFFAQVAKEKVTKFARFLSLQFISGAIFSPLLFRPLKYLNNENTLEKFFYFSGNFVFWENFQFCKMIH